MHRTVRPIINGIVTGLTERSSKNLLINGVGFRAILQGDKIALALGKSHDISHPIPEGVTVTVEEGTKVRVEGADKQAVGQLAAQIKAYYPVEPYKGKGVSIAGEYIRRKEGKKTA